MSAISAVVKRLHVTEPDALRNSIPGVVIHVTPLAPPDFSVDICTIPLGDVALLHGACSPLVLVATIGPDSVVLQIPLTNADTLLLNGQPVPPCGFGLYGPGAELVRANTQPSDFAVLTMTRATAELGLGPAVPAAARAGGSGALLVGQEEDWLRLTRLVKAAADMAREAEGVFATEPPRQALRASLLGVARDLIEGAHPEEQERRTRTPQAWRRIVMGAEEYLNRHLDRPIYTEELCAALGVSAGSLGDAFRATLTISPHRYLKLRRLNMVRAALMRRDGPAPLVKSVALAHGFWHLGQFARDYRELFGETPSETLASLHPVEPEADEPRPAAADDRHHPERRPAAQAG